MVLRPIAAALLFSLSVVACAAAPATPPSKTAVYGELNPAIGTVPVTRSSVNEPTPIVLGAAPAEPPAKAPEPAAVEPTEAPAQPEATPATTPSSSPSSSPTTTPPTTPAPVVIPKVVPPTTPTMSGAPAPKTETKPAK